MSRYANTVLVSALLILCSLSQLPARGQQVSYANPPRCLIWLEGEECPEHNWTEGPAWNCWAFDWAGVHGGVLDLASWRLPQGGEYYARFPFEVPQAGEYVLYFLGRAPWGFGSPIEWSLDNGPATEPAQEGWASTDDPRRTSSGPLTRTEGHKYVVVRLGTFTTQAGPLILKIAVRKAAADGPWGWDMYSQQIDALGIAPVDWPVVGAAPPAPAASPGYSVPRAGQPAAPITDEPQASPLALSSRRLTLKVSPVHGGLRELLLGPGRPCTLAQVESAKPLLQVEFRDGTVVESGPVIRVAREADRLVLHCAAGKASTVLTYATQQSGEIRITAQVTNRSQSPIWRVQFCLGSGLGVGGDTADDTWLVAQQLLSPVQLVGRHQEISPAGFAFDWVCLTDRRASFYAMFEDRALLDTQVEYGREDQHGATGILAFTKFPRILPGETWTSPPLILGAYREGDWHPAADRFSAWWYSWADSPRRPEWMQGMGAFTAGQDLLSPTNTLEYVQKAVAESLAATGVNWFHGASWFENWTESWYPTQFRRPLNQLRHLRELTDAVREAGGRSSIYTNALQLSRATPEFELWGRDLAVVASNGGIWFTEHPYHHHPMAVPYPNATWGARYAEIMETAVLAGRPDMLYMDQLGAVPAHLDFAPEQHHHQHYGEWTAGSVQFVRTVQARLVLACPNLVTAIETFNPAIQQYVNLSLCGTTPVLRYVFPTYYGFVGTFGPAEPQVLLELARSALLTGEPLHLLDWSLAGADEATRTAVRSLVLLKREVDPQLYAARYRDTVGLSVPSGIRVRVFQGRDRLLLPFVREQSTVESVVLCDPGRLEVKLKGEGRVFPIGSPSQPQPIAVRLQGDGVVKVSLPSQLAAGVIEIE